MQEKTKEMGMALTNNMEEYRTQKKAREKRLMAYAEEIQKNTLQMSSALIAELVAERKYQKKTQQDIADITGILPANIARFENGSRVPTLVVLQKYASALGKRISVTPNGMKYKFPKGVISIVNSFPAAYIISTDKETCGLCDLFDMCSENIDEIVEIVIDLNSCYFAGSKHYRPMLWPCNVDSNEDGAAFLLGYDKVMEASKLAVHSEDSIKKIRARLSSGKR